MEKDSLFELINMVISKNGYKRKSNEWRKEVNGIVSILHIQKSRWKNQYYISIRAKIKSLVKEENFSHHVSIRFEKVLGPEINKIFDFNNVSENNDREEKIKIAVNNLLLILQKFETVEGIKKMISQYGNSVVTTKNAKKLFGI